jgi:outer membrane protein OmpA-like peptidoglycan-associated protein
MTSVGWGQEKPIADNRSEEGKTKNRRVEIVKK